MMADRDLLALAPTGSGKTLGYLLPLLTLLKAPAPVPKSSTQAMEGSSSSEESDESKGEVSTSKPKSSVSPRALILSPTHELALQIASETLKLTQGRKWRVVVLTKANEISVVERGADILICTPQRLLSCIEKRGLSLAKSVLQLLLASATWSNLASTLLYQHEAPCHRRVGSTTRQDLPSRRRHHPLRAHRQVPSPGTVHCDAAE